MAELVGGAFLSAFLDVLFDRMATSEFLGLFRTQKMDMGLLDELKALLLTVSEVLDDAEVRQLASPDSKFKDFLDGLRVAAYEADDLLDLIAYEVTAAKIDADQRATAGKQSWYSSLSNLLIQTASVNDRFEGVSFSRDASERMEKIVERLRSLKQNIDTLGLKKSIGRKDAWPQREQTTSLIQESDIFGRDADRDVILNLLQEDGVDGNAIEVIPIVGMGGIGKTTLAQLVYNHSKAQEFESRAWVCVSDNYDGFRIKKELLKQVNNSVKCDDLASEQIDVELKKSLKDKKYLLVLDDIWDDGYDNWDRLQAPLKSGARGSKIIITTRNQNIALRMGTVGSDPYELHELDAHRCWQLFAKHAFKGGEEDQRLQSIGKEIVSKCGGLPLAAKMLGGLLRGRQEVAEWEATLKSNVWELQDDKVLSALRLSYQHLPSHLKQCFAHCAIFPKDYQMSKEEIIQLWMAEGFLVQAIRGKKMEELGEECFDELVSRSFLQESFDKRSGRSFFCMHDLINDLAQHIVGEFVVRMEKNRSCKIGNRTRHFSFGASKLNEVQISEEISKGHALRTFLSLLPFDYRYRRMIKESEAIAVADEVLLNQILKLRCLRALSLRGFYKVVELPDQIGDLKLLRYLNLAGTRVERLPDSVCTLYNLQTLILYCCGELVELPKNIVSLINLHCLDIRKTRRLQDMPLRMGDLKELRTLGKFIVGKQIGFDINDLGKLHYLRGKLSIYGLQNVADTPKDILKNKKYLKDLELVWNGDTEDSVHERKVLERLKPYTSIKRLSISGYGGTKFADWVGDSSYTNIVSLELHGCKYCTSLPPLELSSLEHLSISSFDAVIALSIKTPLCSLKTLFIKNMRQWKEWIFCEGNDSVKCGSLAKLEELTIKRCPELKSISTCRLTHEIFKSLHILEVGGCPNLKTSNLIAISNFSKIPHRLYSSNFRGRDLFFGGSEVILKLLPSAMYGLSIDEPAKEGIEEMGIPFNSLEDIEISSDLCECIPLEEFPKLKSLYLAICKNLKSLSASEVSLHHRLNSLVTLKILGCDSLISFPKGGIAAPNLTHLELDRCSNLKSLPEGMHELLPSLLHLVIRFCGEIESFPEGGLPANLQSLEIGSCKKLIGGRLEWGLQRLNALSHLRLSWYEGDDLDSFPEETLLPSTLSILKICEFRNMKGINYKGLQHLTSLAALEIDTCPYLQCLPEEGLPSSLSRLYIGLCPLLEERCEREKGEDWPKISHISDIHIESWW